MIFRKKKNPHICENESALHTLVPPLRPDPVRVRCRLMVCNVVERYVVTSRVSPCARFIVRFFPLVWRDDGTRVSSVRSTSGGFQEVVVGTRSRQPERHRVVLIFGGTEHLRPVQLFAGVFTLTVFSQDEDGIRTNIRSTLTSHVD